MKKVLKVSVVKLTEDFSWQRVTVRCLVGISYVSNRSYSQQNLKIKECCRCFQLCTVQKVLSWAPRRKYPQNRLKLVIRLLPCVRSPRLSNQMTEKGYLPVSTLLFYCWIIFLFSFCRFPTHQSCQSITHSSLTACLHYVTVEHKYYPGSSRHSTIWPKRNSMC